MSEEITTKNKVWKYSILLGIAVLIFGAFWIANLTGNAVKDISCEEGSCPIENVKEFAMTSFTEIIDGKYYPQYSLKNITVNKGDKVRIKITVTSGMHDFKIDEFEVYADTPKDEETIIEFVADEAGEFIYYCTKPGHRANGHWGTLIVK
jgi:heme/copper-type cytochrome/quinol oxidase subunit 2